MSGVPTDGWDVEMWVFTRIYRGKMWTVSTTQNLDWAVSFEKLPNVLRHGHTKRRILLFGMTPTFKVVLGGYRRCPDSHDLSECHHLYDLGRHITVLTLTPKKYLWQPPGTTLRQKKIKKEKNWCHTKRKMGAVTYDTDSGYLGPFCMTQINYSVFFRQHLKKSHFPDYPPVYYTTD